MARRIFHGIPISGGIAIGRVFFFEAANYAIRREHIAPAQVEAEIERLRVAALAVKNALEDSLALISAGGAGQQAQSEQAALLRTHILLCDDPKLSAAAERRIREQFLCAEWALEEAVQEIARTFNAMDDAYFRERIQDVRAVAGSISQTLSGNAESPEGPTAHRILAAQDLTPTDALTLPLDRILGIVTMEGGKTSHTGILARGLRIPTLVGVPSLDRSIDGALAVVDGLHGQLLIDPDEVELARYTELQQRFDSYQRTLKEQAGQPCVTTDGRPVPVSANIEFTEELGEVLEEKADGIGLYRSEYAFLRHAHLPDEEELFEEYSALAKALPDKGAVVRTLDLGADKLHPTQARLAEANPALGLRAIRYCLRNPGVFLIQIRAVLRAAALGKISLLLPMISGLQELLDARALIAQAAEQLRRQNIPHNPALPVGVLVEVPSAVLLADVLARHVDFFSIGTNDLIQYTLGIDRGNRHVADLYQPLHPAVLRSVKLVVDAAHQNGITATVCGEMAADPFCLPVLLGMGVDSFSVPPQAVSVVRHIIRNSGTAECAALLEQALAAGTTEQVNALVREALTSRFPEDIIFSTSLLSQEEKTAGNGIGQ